MAKTLKHKENKVCSVFDGQFVVLFLRRVPGSVTMNSSYQLHLPSPSNNVANSDRRKRMVILDVGGERFLCDRELLGGFPGTRLA